MSIHPLDVNNENLSKEDKITEPEKQGIKPKFPLSMPALPPGMPKLPVSMPQLPVMARQEEPSPSKESGSDNKLVTEDHNPK